MRETKHGLSEHEASNSASDSSSGDAYTRLSAGDDYNPVKMFRQPSTVSVVSAPEAWSASKLPFGSYVISLKGEHHPAWDHRPVREGKLGLELKFYHSANQTTIDCGVKANDKSIVGNLTSEELTEMEAIAKQANKPAYTLLVKLLRAMHSSVHTDKKSDREVKLKYDSTKAAQAAAMLTSALPPGEQPNRSEKLSNLLMFVLRNRGQAPTIEEAAKASVAGTIPQGIGASAGYYDDVEKNLEQLKAMVKLAQDSAASKDRGYSTAAREELLALSFGLPGPYEAITVSPYGPSVSSSTDTNYFWFRDLPVRAYKEWVKNYLDRYKMLEMSTRKELWSANKTIRNRAKLNVKRNRDFTKHQSPRLVNGTDITPESVLAKTGPTMSMGTYKMTGRYDQQGRFYISVYDKWDVVPVLPAGAAQVISSLKDNIPPSPEIYFRIYCDPETGELEPGPGWDIE